MSEEIVRVPLFNQDEFFERVSCVTSGTPHAEQRIARALEIAVRFGGFDGSHHKAWAIDQMVRALTGCPITEIREAADNKGPAYVYETQYAGADYRTLVAWARRGEDGPETYEWDEGTPP